MIETSVLRVKELAGNEDFPGIEIKNLELK